MKLFPDKLSLIIFDRDGVINELVSPEKKRGPRNLEELEIREDFLIFMNNLQNSKFNFAVATNQPDISRGYLSVGGNSSIKQQVLSLLPEGSLYLECPHDNQDFCKCRKPKPGMIEEILEHCSVEPQDAIMIGDSWTDVLSGQNAGVYSVLLTTTTSLAPSSQGAPPSSFSPDLYISSLAQLSKHIGSDDLKPTMRTI